MSTQPEQQPTMIGAVRTFAVIGQRYCSCNLTALLSALSVVTMGILAYAGLTSTNPTTICWGIVAAFAVLVSLAVFCLTFRVRAEIRAEALGKKDLARLVARIEVSVDGPSYVNVYAVNEGGLKSHVAGMVGCEAYSAAQGFTLVGKVTPVNTK